MNGAKQREVRRRTPEAKAQLINEGDRSHRTLYFFGGAPRLPCTDTLPRARQLHANPEFFACDFVKVNTLDGNVSSGQVQRSRLANTGCLIKCPVSIGVLCSETLLRVAIRGSSIPRLPVVTSDP